MQDEKDRQEKCGKDFSKKTEATTPESINSTSQSTVALAETKTLIFNHGTTDSAA
jgi:hypothetical protein